MPEDLASEALRRALAVQRPVASQVVHSDQDSQYTATRFKELLGPPPGRIEHETARQLLRQRPHQIGLEHTTSVCDCLHLTQTSTGRPSGPLDWFIYLIDSRIWRS